VNRGQVSSALAASWAEVALPWLCQGFFDVYHFLDIDKPVVFVCVFQRRARSNLIRQCLMTLSQYHKGGR